MYVHLLQKNYLWYKSEFNIKLPFLFLNHTFTQVLLVWATFTFTKDHFYYDLNSLYLLWQSSKSRNSGRQYYRVNTQQSSQHQETESSVSENKKAERKMQEHKKSIEITASRIVGIKVIKQSKSQNKRKHCKKRKKYNTKIDKENSKKMRRRYNFNMISLLFATLINITSYTAGW